MSDICPDSCMGECMGADLNSSNLGVCPTCMQSRSASHDRDANEREIERLTQQNANQRELIERRTVQLSKRLQQIEELRMAASEFVQLQQELCDLLGADVEGDSIALHARIMDGIKAWQAEVELTKLKIITCDVAASHPDANLSRRKDYMKWDSPQAEAVRKLRDERDALKLAHVNVETVAELQQERDRLQERITTAACHLECGDTGQAAKVLQSVLDGRSPQPEADLDQIASYYEHGADIDKDVAGALAQRDASLIGEALRALQRARQYLGPPYTAVTKDTTHDESQCWEPRGGLGKSAQHARVATIAVGDLARDVDAYFEHFGGDKKPEDAGRPVPQLCGHDDGSQCDETCAAKVRAFREYHGLPPKRAHEKEARCPIHDEKEAPQPPDVARMRAIINDLAIAAWADPEPSVTLDSFLAWMRSELQGFAPGQPSTKEAGR